MKEDSESSSPDSSSDDQAAYEVEKILDKKKISGKVYYKVQWKGFPASEATWEPLSHLGNAKDLIRDYRKSEFKSVVTSNYHTRIRAIIHAEKKNGDIVYTGLDKKDNIIHLSSEEARQICPQQIISYYSDEYLKKEEEGSESSEEEVPKKKKQSKKPQKKEEKSEEEEAIEIGKAEEKTSDKEEQNDEEEEKKENDDEDEGENEVQTNN